MADEQYCLRSANEVRSAHVGTLVTVNGRTWRSVTAQETMSSRRVTVNGASADLFENHTGPASIGALPFDQGSIAQHQLSGALSLACEGAVPVEATPGSEPSVAAQASSLRGLAVLRELPDRSEASREAEVGLEPRSLREASVVGRFEGRWSPASGGRPGRERPGQNPLSKILRNKALQRTPTAVSSCNGLQSELLRGALEPRSEERRVGKECRYRWRREQENKNAVGYEHGKRT